MPDSYNQSLSSTIYTYDASGTLIQTDTTTTYNYFTLCVLILVPVIAFLVIRAFLKKKR